MHVCIPCLLKQGWGGPQVESTASLELGQCGAYLLSITYKQRRSAPIIPCLGPASWLLLRVMVLGQAYRTKSPNLSPMWVANKESVQRTVQTQVSLLPLETYHEQVCRLMKWKVIITSLQHVTGELQDPVLGSMLLFIAVRLLSL